MLRIICFVFFYCIALNASAQIYTIAELISNYDEENGCENFQERLDSNLKLLEGKDSSIVHNYCISDTIKKAFKKNTFVNKTCQIMMLKKAIQWDSLHNITNDSVVSKKSALVGVYYKMLKQYDKAIPFQLKALELANNYYPKQSKERYLIFQNLAESLYFKSSYSESLSNLDSTYQLLINDSDTARIARLFDYYARNYLSIGDFPLAEIYNELAQKVASHYKTDYLKGLKSRRLKILFENEKYDEVIKEITGSENTDNIVCPKCDNNYHLTNLLYRCLYSLNKDSTALIFLYKEKEIIDSKYSGERKEIINLNNLSTFEMEFENYNLAEKYLKTVIRLSKHTNAKDLEFLGSQNLLLCYNLMEKYNLSETVVDSVESNFFTNGIDNGYDISFSTHYHTEYLRYFDSFTKLDTNQLDQIIKITNRCDKYIVQNLKDINDSNSISYSLSNKRDFYTSAMQVLTKAYQRTPSEELYNLIFRIMERNKSLQLIQNALENRSEELNNHFEDNQKIDLKIKNNLRLINQNTLKANEVLELTSKIHLLISNQKKLNKTTQRIKNKTFNIITPELNSKNKEQVLIEFFKLNDSTYTRLINSKSIKEISQFSLDTSLLNSFLNNIFESKDSQNSFSENSKELSRVLYPQNLNINLDLIIIPDGALSFLPFEALTYKDKYLIEHCNISYAFSYNHLIKMQEQKRQNDSKIICFAPSYTNSNNTSPELATRSDNVLKTLEYNTSEVENIAEVFPSTKLFIGTEATKTNFLKNINDAHVIHIASHATYAEEDNYIYFNNEDENYTLSLSEIYALEIPAELVTLSACESGIGKNQVSEGVLSLARGFAYAGTKSVVSTLWNVNDHSTSEIIFAFYKYLSEGNRKDEALRLAKLDYIESRPTENDPHLWAGLIAIGDMSPLEIKQDKKWMPYILVSIFCMIFLGTLLKRKKQV